MQFPDFNDRPQNVLEDHEPIRDLLEQAAKLLPFGSIAAYSREGKRPSGRIPVETACQSARRTLP
jgi:hypothetical protein